MKNLIGYTDPWLSPVTGLRNADVELLFPDLQNMYVWAGDKNGRPSPSPILIDILLEMMRLRQLMKAFPDAPFILQSPYSDFPHAQALNQLMDGLLKHTSGVIARAIPNTDYLTPLLPAGNLYIGNAAGFAAPQPTIALANLPDLGTTLSRGKIWRGTSSGRPEESDALSITEADVLALNGRLLTANFIMGDALVRTVWQGAQFLVDLPDGLLKHTGKILEQAVPGTDYLVGENPARDFLAVWGQNNTLTRSTIETLPNAGNPDSVRGIDSLTANQFKAFLQIACDGDIVSKSALQAYELWLYDRDPVHRLTSRIVFKAPASIPGPNNTALVFVLPETLGAEGQVLTDIGAVPLSTDRKLGFRNILPNNLQDALLAQGRDGQNNPIFVNAALTHQRIWVGDANNRPVEHSSVTIDDDGEIYANSLHVKIPSLPGIDRFMGIVASALTLPAIKNWTLPYWNGLPGWVLSTNGAGTLDWVPQIPSRKEKNEDGEDVHNTDGVPIYVPIGIAVVIGALSYFTDSTGAVVGASAATADSLGNVTIPKDLTVAENAQINNNLKVDSIDAHDVSLDSISTEASELDISVSDEAGTKFEGLKFEFDPNTSQVNASFGGDMSTPGNISSGGGFEAGGAVNAQGGFSTPGLVNAGSVNASSGFSTPGLVNAGSVSGGTINAGAGGLVLGTGVPAPSSAISMIAPSGLASSYTIHLPLAAGIAGQVLSTNVQGDWEWVDAGGSTSHLDLVGDVSGSGSLSNPIQTTLNKRLDQITAPQAPLNLNSQKITSLATPTNSTDGANKGYVDDAVASLPVPTLTLQGDISGSGAINAPLSTTFNKTLNQIANAGDINVSNHSLQNILNPTNPQDAATKSYVDSRIVPGGIASLTGFVEGSNPSLGVLTTTRGATCLLKNIPAGGNVDMEGFSVKNVQEMPDDGLDATSVVFVMNLLSDKVGVQWR